MQKPISITLVFIFSFCSFATGAFGYGGCESKCCCKFAMMWPEQASHPLDASKNTSLTKAPDCCSGASVTSCEFTGGTADTLPESVSVIVRTEVPDFSDIARTAIADPIKGAQPKVYAWGPDPWLKTTTLLIYLQHLTFLC
jgi:hypothetical protein